MKCREEFKKNNKKKKHGSIAVTLNRITLQTFLTMKK